MASRTLCSRWLPRNAVSNTKMHSVRQISGSHMYQTSTTKLKKEFNPNSTVDEGEITHHSNYMKDWWNPSGSMKGLHSYNTIRVPFVRDGLVAGTESVKSLVPLKDKKILDVGCGGGILSEPLARLGANVTGIDASIELIECARQHSCLNAKLSSNRPTYICTTVEEHADKHENFYDGIVASEIIEHVNNKELFVKASVKALKPGGRIFFTTPCRSRLSQIATIWLAENVFGVVPKGTHQIEKFTTPTELTFLLERNNCQVELIYGIFYNVLTNTWSWVNSQTLIFALQAVKLS